ncbi:MAG: hypothetical protein M5U25_16365 [Planctomycetota bacterium]|nr:hypothetical protein [Planctomycetota bacterium]
MHDILRKIETLRDEVKARKHSIYALRDGGAVHEASITALLELQARLDELWNGVYINALANDAAGKELEAVRRDFDVLLAQISGATTKPVQG